MSRVLKFRVWDKVDQKMRVVWSISWKAWDFDNGLNVVEMEGDGTYQRREHEVELMQFTGLHDKHGQEIAEGDFIGTVGTELHLWVVEFRNFSWMTRDVQRPYKNWSPLTQQDEQLEILGNRYEHGHLLRCDAQKENGSLIVHAPTDLHSLVARVKALEQALLRYGRHEHSCILSKWRGETRQAPDGGSEALYGYGEWERWYRTQPVNEVPPCQCGFDAALH